jgi:TPR repeat protein
MMGALYKTGTGVKLDAIEAVKWFNLAVANGDTRAAQLRDETIATLQPTDLAEAQRRTDAWLKKSPRERLNP